MRRSRFIIHNLFTTHNHHIVTALFTTVVAIAEHITAGDITGRFIAVIMAVVTTVGFMAAGMLMAGDGN
ncbi:hypothetical protein A0256_21425 [Mucilaginibacter sp. PAMC 26640]|nr:hypothetical protein A0256_21425 [Mucilaginibacter sp. PAMC 26640]